MAITLPLTANEMRAAMILVTECLAGMGGDRPADLGGDEYTWVDSKMLMASGYSAPSANATFGSLMEKGFVHLYDKNEWVLDTPAWQYLDTVWDEYQAAQQTEVQMTKTTGIAKARKVNNAKASARKATENRQDAKSTPTSRKAKRAKAVASNADHITVSKNTSDNAYVYVEAGDGRHFTRLRSGDNKAFRAISAVGMPYAVAERFNRENPAPKPQARLAHGVDSHNSPNSAKAVADQKRGAKGNGKAAKATPAKAGKNKQPSRGAERSYTVVKGTENKARPDSWRHHMTSMIVGATDTAAAKAKHAKSGKFPGNKLDFNWAANNGFIKFS